jgi:hypothetical protein
MIAFDSILEFFKLLHPIIGSVSASVVIGTSLYAFLNRRRIHLWFKTNKFPSVNKEPDHKYDGLIFTVSRPEVPTWVIESHMPEYVGLVESAQSQSSSDKIMENTSSKNVKFVSPQRLVDVDNPEESKHAVEVLIKKLQKNGCKNIAVDITGGKVTMSLGAFMAAEEAGIPTIYISTEFDAALKQPRMETAKIVCVSNPL